MGSTTLLTLTTVLSGIALACSSTATANVTTHQCGSEYQAQNYQTNTQSKSEDYFNLVPTLLDDTEIKKVRSFADELDGGRWHGTGLDIRCTFNEDQSHTTINSFDVDAELDKHFQGGLIMEIQQENAEQVNLDRIFLTPETELDPSLERDETFNSQGQKTGHRSYQVNVSTPGTLIYDEKYRNRIAQPNRASTVLASQQARPPAPFASRLVHEIKTVSFNQTDLTVYRDVYVNGKFVSQQQWQLKRL